MTVGTAVLRLTLHGPAGAVDVLADPGTPAGAVVGPELRAVLGLPPGTPVLASRAGRPLRPDRALEQQAVRDGDRLLVLPPGTVPTAAPPTEEEVRRAVAHDRPRTPVVLAALCLAAAAGTAVLTASALRPVVLVAALLLVVASLVAPVGRWGDAWRLLSPAAAAVAAVLALSLSGGPVGAGLALTSVAVSAAGVAAAQRSQDRGAREELTVWLVAAVALAAFAAAAQLLGLPGASLAALLVGAGSVVLRLLPMSAIDVPDELLLETDRVLVTAWAPPRGERRPRRRRVRAAAVRADVAAGRARLEASVVAVVTVMTAAVLVLLGVVAAGELDSALQRTGARVLCGCLAAALLLQARSYRDPAARAALLAGGSVAGLGLLASLLLDGPAPVLAGAVVGTGIAAVAAAVALGRGWHSVRWARTGDVLELLAVALLLPTSLVAAGAVAYLRSAVS